MIRAVVNCASDDKIRCTYVAPTRKVPDLFEDVYNGLLTRPRYLPPKYFYDDVGSELFEKICRTREYYPTRTEETLLVQHGRTIIAATLPDRIVELGSGSSRKTRRLFDACQAYNHACNYTPFDVCEPMLEQAADDLKSDYPWLEITPLVGDYHAGLGNLPEYPGTNLFIFLGSTIGNFTLGDAGGFLREVHASMRDGDYFLLGADRLKDTTILEAAYNDAEGITAQFNLNVLRVLNRELEADFDPDNFVHKAVFNEAESRIEMYLESQCRQTVRLDKINQSIHLHEEERILTELSHKFDYQQWRDLLLAGGLEIVRHYQPADGFFSLFLCRKS